MNKQLQALKSKLNITNIFSITELSSNKIYLFHNEIKGQVTNAFFEEKR